MKTLTHRQTEVLDFIVNHIHDMGYPPTIREIGTHIQIRSTNGVSDHLLALEKKGFIARREWGRSRDIVVLRKSNGRAAKIRVGDGEQNKLRCQLAHVRSRLVQAHHEIATNSGGSK
ncbi:MAG: hypothetical protein GY832_23655 [Chloroflexi bacterium]|nr:hypothetical protein [Chloroflexota bacterium]